MAFRFALPTRPAAQRAAPGAANARIDATIFCGSVSAETRASSGHDALRSRFRIFGTRLLIAEVNKPDLVRSLPQTTHGHGHGQSLLLIGFIGLMVV